MGAPDGSHPLSTCHKTGGTVSCVCAGLRVWAYCSSERTSDQRCRGLWRAGLVGPDAALDVGERHLEHEPLERHLIFRTQRAR